MSAAVRVIRASVLPCSTCQIGMDLTGKNRSERSEANGPYNASTAYLQMAFVYAKQGQDLKAKEARTKAVALDASLSKYPLPARCTKPSC
jgi:Tfp pilus assembly protein PilF